MKAKFVRQTKEADNIVTFWFEPQHPVDYIAGQYIEMKLPHNHPDDRGVQRWFTLSSSPTDAPFISITTKFSKKSSTFKQALRNLSPGAVVNVSNPMGDFVLPKDDKIPLIFVAGGIGITPFHSIVKWLIDTEQHRDISFLYAINTKSEIVFQKLFEQYGMFRHLLVGERLSGQKILQFADHGSGSLIYIAGPEAMVENLQKDLEAIGVEKKSLVGDFFPGYIKF